MRPAPAVARPRFASIRFTFFPARCGLDFPKSAVAQARQVPELGGTERGPLRSMAVAAFEVGSRSTLAMSPTGSLSQDFCSACSSQLDRIPMIMIYDF